jgi:DnaJ domain
VTHYDVLGVGVDAPVREIRQAYVRLARESHPDFHADADRATRAAHEAEIRRLNQAWAVLGNRESRRRYDESLGLGPEVPRPVAAREPDAAFVPYDDDDTDYAALLDDAPIGRGARLPRAMQLAPAVLLMGAVFGLSAGLVTGFGPLLVLGVSCLVLSALTFVLAPALAVLRSLDSERD